MTDGTSQANAEFRRNVGFYYDLVKASVGRIVTGLAAELENLPVTAVGVTPGWLRSEKMLENFGVTEASWRDACVRLQVSRSPSRRLTSPGALPQFPGRRPRVRPPGPPAAAGPGQAFYRMAGRRACGRRSYDDAMTSAGYLRFPHLHGDLLTFVAEDDVWLAPLDGGRAWRLSADRAEAASPRFSRDGQLGGLDQLARRPGRGLPGRGGRRAGPAPDLLE